MKSYQLLTGAGLSALVLAGPAISNAAPQVYGRRAAEATVYRGDRLDKMTALGDYVASGAEYMLQRANDTIGYNATGQSRALLNELQRFVNDANAFQGVSDERYADANDMTRQVNVLLRDARRVNARIRRVPATRDVWDDWSALVDGVNRMQRLAAGYDVTVPTPRSEWADGGYAQDNPTYRDDHYAYPRTSDVGGYRGDVLAGTRLSEFRRLAHDLDTYAARAHDNAERNGLATEETRERFLENLHHFAENTRALHERSDNDQLLPSDLGPTVSHLLADAREVDRSMRQAGAYQEVWSDWQRVVATLQRMDDLLRR